MQHFVTKHMITLPTSNVLAGLDYMRHAEKQCQQKKKAAREKRTTPFLVSASGATEEVYLSDNHKPLRQRSREREREG